MCNIEPKVLGKNGKSLERPWRAGPHTCHFNKNRSKMSGLVYSKKSMNKSPAEIWNFLWFFAQWHILVQELQEGILDPLNPELSDFQSQVPQVSCTLNKIMTIDFHIFHRNMVVRGGSNRKRILHHSFVLAMFAGFAHCCWLLDMVEEALCLHCFKEQNNQRTILTAYDTSNMCLLLWFVCFVLVCSVCVRLFALFCLFVTLTQAFQIFVRCAKWLESQRFHIDFQLVGVFGLFQQKPEA